MTDVTVTKRDRELAERIVNDCRHRSVMEGRGTSHSFDYPDIDKLTLAIASAMAPEREAASLVVTRLSELVTVIESEPKLKKHFITLYEEHSAISLYHTKTERETE